MKLPVEENGLQTKTSIKLPYRLQKINISCYSGDLIPDMKVLFEGTMIINCYLRLGNCKCTTRTLGFKLM